MKQATKTNINDTNTNINDLAVYIANIGYLKISDTYEILKTNSNQYELREFTHCGDIYFSYYSYIELKKHLNFLKKSGEILDVNVKYFPNLHNTIHDPFTITETDICARYEYLAQKEVINVQIKEIENYYATLNGYIDFQDLFNNCLDNKKYFSIRDQIDHELKQLGLIF